MRLTYELLCKHGACEPQRDEFRRLYPDGCEPTVDVLTALANSGYTPGCLLDVFWLVRLLPEEGPGSARAFALWCAEQVAPLAKDKRVDDCLAVVRRRVDAPGSCTDGELAAAGAAAGEAAWEAAREAAGAAAWAAAREAAGAAAGEAAMAAAREAAREAAWAAARESQIACLSQLLLEAE
jgi:hypothetical protein